MLFDYDDKDKDSIYQYAKKLEGMTFREIVDAYNESPIKQYEDMKAANSSKVREAITPYMAPNYIYNPNAKGQLGGLLENCYFGYKPNSEQEADFSNVGIELKQTPIDETKKGKLRAGERLSITNISFDSPVEENFYQSHLWNKIKLILLVQYIRNKSVDRLDYRISFVNFFSPPEKDLLIIRQDYEKINDKIKAGKAHELSESDTLYLGAATKGATAQKSMVPQYYGDHTLAKKRNYCYKQKYMNYVLHEYVLKNNVPCEPIIQENELRDTTFEVLITSKIDKYIGKSDKELCKLFNVPYTNNKAQWNTLSFRMLGITGNHAEEFVKAGIEVKTIRIEENGKIRENMSFAPFKFKELVKEEWESSTIHEYFDTTRFFFILFKRIGDHYVLEKSMFWNMPYHDLNDTVHSGWKAVQDKIKQGVSFRLKKKSNGEIEIENDLPKVKDNPILHIRPHATKSAYLIHGLYTHGNIERDADELPDGNYMTRQSFWIRNTYLLNQVINEEKIYDNNET